MGSCTDPDKELAELAELAEVMKLADQPELSPRVFHRVPGMEDATGKTACDQANGPGLNL